MTNTRFAYVGIVLLGCGIAFVSSFSTQYAQGYFLNFGDVLMGFVPYLIFAMGAYLLRGGGFLTILLGLVLLVVHAWMVYSYHFVLQDADNLLLFGPPVLGIILLPHLFYALRKSKQALQTAS